MRDVRVILLSVMVSVVLGTLIALSLGTLLGGMPTHSNLMELLTQVPAALLFGLLTSIFITLPLGLFGGLVAVFVLRHNPQLPRESWMLRGCTLGAAMGFLPFAAWDIIIERASDALVFPVLCGMGGAWAGAILGSVLSRFHSTFVGSDPGAHE
jgi:hypothetical protein